VLALIIPTALPYELENLGEQPLAYLSLCCSKSNDARLHLLKCLLERASVSLIAVALENRDIGSRFNSVSRVLLTSGGPLTTSNDIDLSAVLRLLRLAFMHGLSPLVDLAGYLLAMPSSRQQGKSLNISRDDLKLLHDQLASNKAEAFAPQQIELTRQGIYAIEVAAPPDALLTNNDDMSASKGDYSMPMEVELILQQCLRVWLTSLLADCVLRFESIDTSQFIQAFTRIASSPNGFVAIPAAPR
jgi:hypothetical protein